MRHLVSIGLLLAVLALSGCWRPQGNQGKGFTELELVAAYAIDMDLPLEPSGLVRLNGILYTVADKDNRTIYKVELVGDSARLVPAIRFQPPGYTSMDWEGIAADDQGTLYLVSETRARILEVTLDGQANWATPPLRDHLTKAGLYAKKNAGFEGITWLGPDHWLGAVEREPRGLADISLVDGQVEVTATQQEHSPFSNALPLLRLPDFSGLDSDGENIYALFRNAHLIVRLERVENGFVEAEAWSYRHIETDPRWAYRSQVYGQAEGLVVEGQDVYLIFDNNLGPRAADPKDGRPLLIHARFPEQS
ncbi:MAG: esterase-like activity of phytase family protein [Puniceicoccaceae bacterium]